jgi:hypothetical protein
MSLTLAPLDPDALTAMFSVAVEGVPAIDAWLGYVRRRHPDACGRLAEVALTGMALDLLVEHGHVSRDEAIRQRRLAAESAARALGGTAWEEIHRLRQTLTMLERLPDEVDDPVVDLRDDPSRLP